ncbi:hypothetical protein I7I50_05549 [Histoplasma capsulatum G186AR]|uniref:Uncharacterized protein n=1 Tax=Ajellomyces capsulatus TaxID=5037 RepID=A0A8H8D909_AJECA|nr:hypothetical protein I7I52_03809 [Histoplasma capsulatum]QSS76183.1 hypothetical protein I7I50_05549 [Histoplasma capsulatum G186AR]
MISEFRAEYKKNGLLDPGPAMSNFATLNGRQAARQGSRTCICGSNHSCCLLPCCTPSSGRRKENMDKKREYYLKITKYQVELTSNRYFS